MANRTMRITKITTLGICLCLFFSASCIRQASGGQGRENTAAKTGSEKKIVPKTEKEIFLHGLIAAAMERTKHEVKYDAGYVSIDYPGGDVPDDKGVCSDVIIRAYRKVGIDLQKDVHEDMKANFHLYPKKWGLKRTDKNIDHRRVPNLLTFFSRRGEVLTVTKNPDDYNPGDLVTWDLADNLPHIGIVVYEKSADGHRHKIVHNIGAGPVLEDMLFDYKITGHFRYFGDNEFADDGD